MQGLYRMNKKYLYGLSVQEPVVVETPPISRTDSNIFTPLLELHPPAPQPRKSYCSRLTHVVVNYIKMHPFIFIIEILIVGALCYFLEMMMGGICVFKHGRMNIQDYSQTSYFPLGEELRMSTVFTRESQLLPSNRALDNFCTYGKEFGDICHLYLNPDKENMSALIVTLHLMNSEDEIRDEAPVYKNVKFLYIDATAGNETAQTEVNPEVVPYKYFELRDQRALYRIRLDSLAPSTYYVFGVSFFREDTATTTTRYFRFKSLPAAENPLHLQVTSNRLENNEKVTLKLD
jgi:hypothetical protein